MAVGRWSTTTILCTIVALAGCPSDPTEVTATSDSSSGEGDTTETPPDTDTTPGNTSGVATGGMDETAAPSDACCSPHPNPGCEDPGTAACVCEQDASCCAFEWSASCAAMAEACGGCEPGGDTSTDDGPPPPPPMGECCEPMAKPGCPADPRLEMCVCDADPFCCDTEWDGKCVAVSINACGQECGGGGDGGPPPGDCCSVGDGTGCEDPGITECVCDADPFCCEEQWDDLCVGQAHYVCEADCGFPPAGGDCCEPHDAPSCDEPEAAECVCDIAPPCCYTPWSEDCVLIANTQCDLGCEGFVPPPPCCLPSEEPGCENEPVEMCVCDADPFCCDMAWDGKCVGAAQGLCGLDCDPPPPGGSDSGGPDPSGSDGGPDTAGPDSAGPEPGGSG